MPESVDSTANDFPSLKNIANLLKYSLPAEIGTSFIEFGAISFAISSALRNDNPFSGNSTSASVLFPLPFAPAIIYNIFLFSYIT